MSLTKLGHLATALRVSNKHVLTPRLTACRTAPALLRHKSEKSAWRNEYDDDVDKNQPIKFLNSDAAKWNPVESRTGVSEHDWPWYQTYVIIASLSTFLIYFCVLREENDIDELLTVDLYDHFQEQQRAALAESQTLPQKILKERKLM